TVLYRQNPSEMDKPLKIHGLPWFGIVLPVGENRLPLRALFAHSRAEWKPPTGRQSATWQRSLKALYSNLIRVYNCRLPGYRSQDSDHQGQTPRMISQYRSRFDEQTSFSSPPLRIHPPHLVDLRAQDPHFDDNDICCSAECFYRRFTNLMPHFDRPPSAVTVLRGESHLMAQVTLPYKLSRKRGTSSLGSLSRFRMAQLALNRLKFIIEPTHWKPHFGSVHPKCMRKLPLTEHCELYQKEGGGWNSRDDAKLLTPPGTVRRRVIELLKLDISGDRNIAVSRQTDSDVFRMMRGPRQRPSTAREVFNQLANIRVGFQRGNTLRSALVQLKDRLQANRTRDCVYKIKCSDCIKVYIGQTARELHTRIGEHKRKINKPPRNADEYRALLKDSAIVEHALDTGHKIDLENVEVFQATTTVHITETDG
ncbi:hypothetical protein CLF_109134, partial [Clonorchis sinensis]